MQRASRFFKLASMGLALVVAMSLVSAPTHAANVVPSIEITGGPFVANTCDSTLYSNIWWPVWYNVADYIATRTNLTVPGYGVVDTYVHNGFFGLDNVPGTFGMVPPDYQVAAHTPITLTAINFAPFDLDGVVVYVSSVTWDCSTGLPVQAGGGTCADGRINPDACAGPVALYCDGTTLKAYDIDPQTGEGSLVFTFSGWPDSAPGVNTLLASEGSTQLWHLDSGEFQVNADQGEGKTYAFVFNGCPYDGGGYNANLDPND